MSQLADIGDAYTTVGAIAQGLPVHPSVVSRHLRVLRDAGMVEADRRGQEVHYRLRHRDVAATLRTLADAVEAAILTEVAGADRR